MMIGTISFRLPLTDMTMCGPHLTKCKLKTQLNYFLFTTYSLKSISLVIIDSFNAISDHTPLLITLITNTFVERQGFWRFKNELLKQPEFVLAMNDIIKNTIKRYLEI